MTAGLAWDVAANGTETFVAHGFLGVGVYDASTRDIRFLRRLWLFPWHVFVTVAVGQGRLYAGTLGGTVFVWDLNALDREPEEFEVGRGLLRLRMRGRHLLALTRGGSRLEVYDAASPDAPSQVWVTSDGPLATFTAQDSGLDRFWLGRRGVFVARYEGVQ